MAIACSRCGKTLPDPNARFCNNCGARVPNPSADVIQKRPDSTKQQPSAIAWPEPMTHVVAQDKPVQPVKKAEQRQISQPGLPDLPVTPRPQNPTSIVSFEEFPTTPMPGIPMQDIRANQPLAPMQNIQANQPSARMQQPAYTPPRQSYTPPTKRPINTARVVVIAVLAAVIVGVLGVGSWVLIAQPFTLSPDTQPFQRYENTQFGFGVSYPSNWKAPVADNAKKTITFADENSATRFIVSSTDKAGDVAQALQAQMKVFGADKVKAAAPVNFAGAQWQQSEGNVQQDGVAYKATVLATVHNNRVYTITQLAPQSMYADNEAFVFAPMRSLFRFL